MKLEPASLLSPGLGLEPHSSVVATRAQESEIGEVIET